uniref:Beta-microseminoprotein n=1 Tax=Poecilia reticulata TaxID=8081 RepID=A0A3P9QFI2_POERE
LGDCASVHVLFFCLLGLFVLCHSDCFFQELVIKDLTNPPKGCVDGDGKERGFGSEWVREHMECSCTKEGLSCCSLYIPEECELVVDKDACSAKMVQKSDKTQPCYPF